MIQRYLKELLENEIHELIWTVDYRTQNDNLGVVYYSGGEPKKTNDIRDERLTYQVEIRSSNYDVATFKAQQVYDFIHGINDINLTVNTYKEQKIYIQYIKAITPPLRIGVRDNRMIYTINFEALILPQC
ncbi:phage tail terminator protein [Staphylococcus xylosus]